MDNRSSAFARVLNTVGASCVGIERVYLRPGGHPLSPFALYPLHLPNVIIGVFANARNFAVTTSSR